MYFLKATVSPPLLASCASIAYSFKGFRHTVSMHSWIVYTLSMRIFITLHESIDSIFSVPGYGEYTIYDESMITAPCTSKGAAPSSNPG